MLYRNMRQHERKDIRVRGWIRDEREEVTPCWVQDISAGGAKLTFIDRQPPDTFKLMFSEFATNHRLCVVRWRTLDSVGVQFLGKSQYVRSVVMDAPSMLLL
jgi:hypothetical protein